MHRSVAWRGFSLGLILFTIAGCDDVSSGKKAVGPPPAVAPVDATTVALVMPAAGIAELDIWEATARRDESRTKAIVDIFRPAKDAPPSALAEQIDKAIASAPTAIILIPNEAPEVRSAIAEVKKAGIPLIFLDHRIPLDGEPVPTVAFRPADAAPPLIVAGAIEDAKTAGFPAEGPAIIMKNGFVDTHGSERVAALKKALESKGVRVLPIVEFTGLSDQSKEAISEAFKLHPEVSMVFADEDNGVKGASIFRNGLDHTGKRFVLSGYTHEHRTLDLVEYNVCAAIGERKITVPISRAIDAALALAHGDPVAADLLVPTVVHRAKGPEIDGIIPSFLNQPKATVPSGAENSPSGSNARPD